MMQVHQDRIIGLIAYCARLTLGFSDKGSFALMIWFFDFAGSLGS